MSAVRVVLPHHLRTLANTDREIVVEITGPVTQRTILEAVEKRYPMLDGAIRDHLTRKRRALVRFFACGEDLSHDSPDAVLPAKVANGEEPFVILGAIAGG
jgi:hypothetical protein